MAKKPGLPGGSLDLEVDEGAFGEPAHVPDYLDRAFGTAAEPKQQNAEAKPTPKPATTSSKRTEQAREPKRDAKVVELERARPEKTAPERRATPRRSARKELSIDAETARMIDRVVGDLRESTPQKDATASEFARAIIQLAEESRHHQDFTHVGRRGQWGSPTARAFVADLKEGFLRAIGRHFMDRYPNEAREHLNDALADEDA